VFARALANGFVWDDAALIVDNIGYRGFDARRLRWMFTTFHMANYAPLAWISMGVDYAVWGLDPVGFHLTNVIFHAANAALFFILARELILLGVGAGIDAGAVDAGAVAAALLFSVHPMRVESVAWASERRDVLAGFFFLSTLLFYVRDHSGPGGASPRRRAIALLAYAAAVLSKATVIPLPAALVALDIFPLRRLAPRPSSGAWRACLREKLPYLLLSAAGAALAVGAQMRSGNFARLSDYGMTSRLAQTAFGFGFYIVKTLIPAGLCALYPRPLGMSLVEPRVIAGILAAAAAALGLRKAGVRPEARAALWIYYSAMIFPVLGLLQNGGQSAALRYSYLSCLGWAVLAGTAVALSAARLRRGPGAAAPAALAAAAIPALAALTWSQTALWRDDVALWSDVYRQFPQSCDAQRGLGAALAGVGRISEAGTLARAALKNCPDRAPIFLQLGALAAAAGRSAEAEENIRRALALSPGLAEAHDALGGLLFSRGRVDLALPHFRAAVGREPRSAQRRDHLGAALAVAGDAEGAAAEFAEAVRLEPANPLYRGHLAQARGAVY